MPTHLNYNWCNVFNFLQGVIIPNMEETNMEIDTCLSTHEPSRFVDTTSQLVTKLWKEEYCVHDLLQKKVFDVMLFKFATYKLWIHLNCF